MYNEEALKSNYKYNMLFNSISNSNNSDEDANFNTNIISDFDLQNFDPKRYEYYTNLLKVFNNDPETLYNVLNKYNSIKSLKVKEKKIIREINDYVNKLNDIKPAGQTAGGGGSSGDNVSGGGGDNVDLLKIKKRANKLLTEADKLLGKSKELELNNTFINAIAAFIPAINDFKGDLGTEDKHQEANIRHTSMFDNAINTLSEAVETEAYRDDDEEQAVQAGGVSLINLLKEVSNTGPAGPPGGEDNTDPTGAAGAVKGTQANSKKKAQDREALISTAEKMVLTAKKIVEDTKIALKNIEDKNNEDIKRFQRAILGELNTDYNGKIEADTRAKAIKEKIKNVIKKDRGLTKSVDAFNDVVAETDGIAKYFSDYEFRDYDQSVDVVSGDGTGVAAAGVAAAAGVGAAAGATRTNTDTLHQSGEVIDGVLNIVNTQVSNPKIPPTIEAVPSLTPLPTLERRSSTLETSLTSLTSLTPLPTLERRSSTLETSLTPLTSLTPPSTLETPPLTQPPTLQTPPRLEDPPVSPMKAASPQSVQLNMVGSQPQIHDGSGDGLQETRTALEAQGQGLQNLVQGLQGAPATIIAEGQGALNTKVQEVQNQVTTRVRDLQGAPAALAVRGQEAAQAAIGAQFEKLSSLSGYAPTAALLMGGPIASAAVKGLLNNTKPPPVKRSQSAKFGGQLGGDDLNDDTLKARYLETRPQRYSKIINDEKTIKRFKDKQIENNRNIEIKTNNKIEQLANDIDVYNALSFEEKKDSQKNKEIIHKIKNFENDPKNPLEELALTFDDRIVFIIATFFIRYVTIIMVQWCIDINIIKSFYEGFIYYAIIYIILFWFIVLFINIDNSFDVKYMNFNGIINSIRTLFYYFYMGTNGISRLLIHTSLILILIVIPIILNIKKKPTFNDDDAQDESMKILEYEERKQLSKSLSLFTMFIWLFTSIIATKF
jgi:hypothetical protein